MATFREMMQEMEDSGASRQQQGQQHFELLVLQYLREDPVWQEKFCDVWRWADWPDRDRLSYSVQDLGIDLVAKFAEREDGEPDFAAVQCKLRDPSTKIDKSELTGFTGVVKPEDFRLSILVATCEMTGPARKVAKGMSSPPVVVITEDRLASAQFEWATLEEQAELERITRYTGEVYDLREHQLAPVVSTLRVFYGKVGKMPDGWKETAQKMKLNTSNTPKSEPLADRGQVLMPCGTGKTFTALKLCEQAARLRQDKTEPYRVLYLMPSLSLFEQTNREWEEQKDPVIVKRKIEICSDNTAGYDTIESLLEMEGAPTTDPAKIHKQLTKKRSDVDLLVVFSTYHSCGLVGDAQRPGKGKKAAPEFDLIICDEAHRTTGVERGGEDLGGFMLHHRNDRISAKKRLYMTATPRIYTEGLKGKAKEAKAKIYSMDSAEIFGEVLHKLSFVEAIDQKLLCNYKVLAITVDPSYRDQLLKDGLLKTQKDDDDNLEKFDLDYRAKAIATVKALAGGEVDVLYEDDEPFEYQPIPTSIAFANTIPDSEKNREVLDEAAKRLNKRIPKQAINLKVEHVDGTTNARERSRLISWLGEQRGGDFADEFRMLTNARCLSEGVDVPSLDGALFMAPKHSAVDIVQQVGRVMRKAAGKERGYVVVPIGLADGATMNDKIGGSGDYKTIAKVARALKAHDAELGRSLNVHDVDIEVRHYNGDTAKLANPRLSFEEKKAARESLRLATSKAEEALKIRLYEDVSDKEYWETWAKDIAEQTKKLQNEIVAHLKQKKQRPIYTKFLANCKETISPHMTDEQAVGLLAQHLITKPVFESLYENYDFASNNAISKILDPVCDEIVDAGLLEEIYRTAESFYASVRLQAKAASKEGIKARHELIKQLYQTYIKNAMPEMAEQLGVVYTPVEIVDWLLLSADDVLRQEFRRKLEDDGVDILDPFSGTGTFLTRLIQLEHTREDEPNRTHLIATDKLRHKYTHEMSAIEIMPTAYYISDINIEEAYNARMNAEKPGHEYLQYGGMALGNTLIMPAGQAQEDETFKSQLFHKGLIDQNTPQLNRIAKKDVRVIVGNPPWRKSAKNTATEIPNDAHEDIDEMIKNEYASRSRATLNNALYDLYIKSIRWASSRIGEEGVIAFVTNGGWLDGEAASGLRACLIEEFTAVYAYNLRGQSKNKGGGENEGGNVFGVQVPISLVVLVKNSSNSGNCEIRYFESSDGATSDEKLEFLSSKQSLSHIPWSAITPDGEHDWINQGSENYKTFFDTGNKATKNGKDKSSIFALYSLGLSTNRDDWAYDSDVHQLRQRSEKAVNFYHTQLDQENLENPNENHAIHKWHTDSRKALLGRKKLDIGIPIRKVCYRPFFPQYVHYEKGLNARHSQQDKIFPIGDAINLTINSATKGAIDFDVLMTGQGERERERNSRPSSACRRNADIPKVCLQACRI